MCRRTILPKPLKALGVLQAVLFSILFFVQITRNSWSYIEQSCRQKQTTQHSSGIQTAPSIGDRRLKRFLWRGCWRCHLTVSYKRSIFVSVIGTIARLAIDVPSNCSPEKFQDKWYWVWQGLGAREALLHELLDLPTYQNTKNVESFTNLYSTRQQILKHCLVENHLQPVQPAEFLSWRCEKQIRKISSRLEVLLKLHLFCRLRPNNYSNFSSDGLDGVQQEMNKISVRKHGSSIFHWEFIWTAPHCMYISISGISNAS